MTDKEKQILSSWQTNAKPWIDVVEGQKIESRKVVTDRAIIDTVMGYKPASILDIGCGEGWLVRALSAADHSLSVTGIDAIPELIKRAEQGGVGRFYQLQYDEITAANPGHKFDIVVCNFSLLGDTSVEQLCSRVSVLLGREGRLVIQTLHPLMSCGDQAYQDGWREGTWAGIEGEFSDPAPWYFRTLSGWCELLKRNGLTLEALKEPVDPRNGKPASLILVAHKTL